jgi:hypothetical protein
MQYPWTCNERNIGQRGTIHTPNRVNPAIGREYYRRFTAIY